MNISEMYGMVPGVMTPEEEEDWHHEPCDDIIDTAPSWYNTKMLMYEPACPEACSRREFEARKPALGLSLAEVDELEAHEKLEDLLPVQRRKLFHLLRSALLRHLIPCDGCSTVTALCGVLRAEIASEVPAPVPEWYVYSTTTMGPRKIGYDHCENRGCFRTETPEKKFMKCSRCKLPFYCSKECQAADWKTRHKKVCKAAVSQREKTAKVGRMMQFLSDASLSAGDDGGGGGGGGGEGIAALLQRLKMGMGPDAATAERVARRRGDLKAEKHRGGRGKKKKKNNKQQEQEQEQEGSGSGGGGGGGAAGSDSDVD
jgi:hypothetical protein